MLIPALLTAHLAIAQTAVVVTEDDGRPIGVSPAIEGAKVRVSRNTIEIRAPQTTDSNGKAILERASEFRELDLIYAEKDDRQSDGRRWRDVARENPIHLRLKQRRQTGRCQYTVQRVVVYRMPDGSQTCRAVYETVERDCPPTGKDQFEPPATPPPTGYRYEFAYYVTRWDAARQMWAHRPYWTLVPACTQQVQHVLIQSVCGCR